MMVTPLKIEHLRLKAFRGATHEVLIPFDASKRVTMIFGENGTGKSTIVDGLTYLCDGTFGSLADRSGAKKFEFLTSISSLAKDVLVELKLDGKLITATQPKVNPPHLASPGKPQLRVLRRASLSEFVEAEPKQRFEKLKPFLATANVESCEGSLRKAADEVAVQSSRFVRDTVLSERALTELWTAEGGKKLSAHVWAAHVGGLDVAAEQNFCDAVDAVESHLAAHGQRRVSAANALTDHTTANGAVMAAEVSLNSAKSSSSSAADTLLAVLKAAKVHLKTHAAGNCPVCEQPVSQESLQISLEARIVALGALDNAVALYTQATQKLTSADAVLNKQHALLTSATQELLSDLTASGALLGDTKDVIKAFEKSMSLELSLAEQIAGAALASSTLDTWLIPLRTAAEQKRKQINLKNAAQQALNAIAEAKQKSTDSASLEKKLKAALAIVEEQRKAFIRNALQQVSGDIDALYAKLHPGEPLNTIKLGLKDGAQGSLDITANFETKTDVPPQAYYSEAHLDTLGICIFMAFAKKYSAPGTLVVLDDVLTSVDSVHLDRFIDFIDDQAVNFGHVVMTTHYRPWRERFRFHQAASAQIHFVELKEWALNRGVLHDQTKTTLGELKLALDPMTFDRQVAASKAGIFLERVFDFLTIKYQAKMPRKTAGDYTLGEFLGAFQGKHLNQLEVEKADAATGIFAPRIPLEPLFSAIDQFVWIRNQVGCHFNAGAAGASDADVRKFGEAVVALGEALVCPTGSDFPERDGGSFWQSKAKRCRMYPHKMI